MEVSNASTQKWFGRDDFIIGSEPLSEESLSLITADDDPLWFKLVHWVASAPIYAEEQKISQDTFFDMPQVDLFQPMISNDLMRNVIQTVGSYGEILARNAA